MSLYVYQRPSNTEPTATARCFACGYLTGLVVLPLPSDRACPRCGSRVEEATS